MSLPPLRLPLYVVRLFVCLGLAIPGSAQKDTSFPAGWSGMWAGTLEIFAARGKVQSVPMELHILPIDSITYTWSIIYGEDKIAGKRDYEIKAVDAAKGVFIIDEKNSIVLDAFLLGGKLFEDFEVDGNRLLSMTEKSGDQLHFEIISSHSQSARITGGVKSEEEDIPEVKSFPVRVRQYAVLSRL